MGLVTMSIAEPAHDSRVAGRTQQVHFRGRIDAVDPAAGQLWTRWYSSLPAAPGIPPDPRSGTTVDLDKVAISPPGGALAFDRTLWIGSHTITFTAKDVRGDDKAALTAVQHAGAAGGTPAPGVPAPCVIHVLIAEPVRLSSAGADNRRPLARAAGVWAEAPVAWPDPAYQAVNRIEYRWVFTTPSGTEVAALRPLTSGLQFAARSDTHPPCVGIAPIPATVPAGAYNLTLQVGFGWNETSRTYTNHDEKTVSVTVTN
ncbi:hypothetical protein SAMN05421678_12918 [Actinopolymorpha cephalotaxi]|uniref:Uncharacterized protein n=1 Tax=Actinopolymorpha cephalotaxi TaxID=504797 RepID=A0A1I3C4K0_9ACTN|nr:hypothetical protein [Actinopolymorpha cephalotaxi]NYH85407.1 hypothetical protein [Actinopolymorpha cephalotaxi]SFH69474.1 hypothetical protein SAMN05421678_12918 [Actinopolymorpha cephalotaxi]